MCMNGWNPNTCPQNGIIYPIPNKELFWESAAQPNTTIQCMCPNKFMILFPIVLAIDITIGLKIKKHYPTLTAEN